MEFGQLIQYNKINIFPKNYAEAKEAERLAADHFSF